MRPLKPQVADPRPLEQPDWPNCLRASFLYDRQEVWGERLNPGCDWSYVTRPQAKLDAATAMCALEMRVSRCRAMQDQVHSGMMVVGLATLIVNVAAL